MMTVYPGLKKRFAHSLQCLSYPLPAAESTWLSQLRQRYVSRPFAMGQYASSTVTLYRMVLLRDYGGTELMQFMKPSMSKCSQSLHNTEVDCTRTGSLFFAAIGNIKLQKDDELIFLCNLETNNFTVWIHKKNEEHFKMHFTVESSLLIECINYAFGMEQEQEQNPIFKTTFP